MRIGCDIDGVLADWNSSFIERLVKVSGRDLFPPRPFEILEWNYPEVHGYTKAELQIVWDSILQEPIDHFWGSIRAYPGAAQMLGALADLVRGPLNAHVYFVTARPGILTKGATETWLSWEFENPTVLMTGAKGLVAKALALDAFLDDNYDNCVDVYWTSPTTQVFLFDRPWNRQYGPGNGSDFVRVGSVQEMLTILGGTHERST